MKQFINQKRNTVKKQDLESFMRVRVRSGDSYIVIRNVIIDEYNVFMRLADYDDDLSLINEDCTEFDIVEVYAKPEHQHQYIDHDITGKKLWVRSEFEDMRIAVPYPWMREEVEKWAKNNGVEWANGKSRFDEWSSYRENSVIEISEKKRMFYADTSCYTDVITFSDFCNKTGHEPEKWGVSGNKENKYLIKELFKEFERPFNYFTDVFYIMDKHGCVWAYNKFTSDDIKEISMEEAYRKMGKKMPKQEQEIEIDGKMFSVSTIKNALKAYCND